MKNSESLGRFLHVLIDVCSIVIAFFIAYYLRFHSAFINTQLGNFYPLEKYLALLIYLVPLYLVIYYLLKLYDQERGKSKGHVIFKVIVSNVIGIALFLFLLYIQKEFNISRIFLILFFAINVILGAGFEVLCSHFIKDLRRKDCSER